MNDKLQELLERFRTDETWNTLNHDGSHRFDKEIAWIEEMVKSYAVKLNLTTDKVVEIMEKNRHYSWPNYYQPANFPGVDNKDVVGVFDTFEVFRDHAKKTWAGFRCSRCGALSPHPQLCIHRLEKDGKCDWCSFGLFKEPKGVIILENGLEVIPIFEPVPKEAKPDA